MKPQEITRDPLDAVIPLDAGEAVSPASYGRRAAKDDVPRFHDVHSFTTSVARIAV